MGGTREWRQARIAAGRCVDCGQPRQPETTAHNRAAAGSPRAAGPKAPTPPPAPTATRCGACAARQRDAGHRLRRERRRDETPQGALTEGQPYHTGGGAPRLHAVKTLRVKFDSQSARALEELVRREKERMRRQGVSWTVGHIGRIVRETILGYERDGDCSGRPGRYIASHVALCFRLDARTWAVLRRIAAARFGGNYTATVRAMIYYAAFPPLRAVVAGKRRLPE